MEKDLVSNSQNSQFYKSDLDLMTLVLKLDLDMVKMYYHTRNEDSMSRHSKVIAQRDKQTDRHTDSMKTLPCRIRGGNNYNNPVITILMVLSKCLTVSI